MPGTIVGRSDERVPDGGAVSHIAAPTGDGTEGTSPAGLDGDAPVALTSTLTQEERHQVVLDALRSADQSHPWVSRPSSCEILTFTVLRGERCVVRVHHTAQLASLSMTWQRGVPDSRSEQALEYVVRANWGLRTARLGLDLNAAEVHVRHAVKIGSLPPTNVAAFVRPMYRAAVAVTRQYMPGFLSVCLGSRNPRQAVAICDAPRETAYESLVAEVRAAEGKDHAALGNEATDDRIARAPTAGLASLPPLAVLDEATAAVDANISAWIAKEQERADAAAAQPVPRAFLGGPRTGGSGGAAGDGPAANTSGGGEDADGIAGGDAPGAAAAGKKEKDPVVSLVDAVLRSVVGGDATTGAVVLPVEGTTTPGPQGRGEGGAAMAAASAIVAPATPLSPGAEGHAAVTADTDDAAAAASAGRARARHRRPSRTSGLPPPIVIRGMSAAGEVCITHDVPRAAPPNLRFPSSMFRLRRSKENFVTRRSLRSGVRPGSSRRRLRRCTVYTGEFMSNGECVDLAFKSLGDHDDPADAALRIYEVRSTRPAMEHLVDTRGIVEIDGHHYVIMELCVRSLEDRLFAGAPTDDPASGPGTRIASPHGGHGTLPLSFSQPLPARFSHTTEAAAGAAGAAGTDSPARYGYDPASPARHGSAIAAATAAAAAADRARSPFAMSGRHPSPTLPSPGVGGSPVSAAVGATSPLPSRTHMGSPQRTSGMDRAYRAQSTATALAFLEHGAIGPVATAGAAVARAPPDDHGITRQRPYTITERLRLLEETARALTALHERHCVHGDVRPSNVLVDAAGRAKVSDFWVNPWRWQAPSTTDLEYAAPEVIAALRDTLVSSSSADAHSRDAAMEQARARQIACTREADVYSFGLLALYLIRGKDPWDEVREVARERSSRDTILLEKIMSGKVTPPISPPGTANGVPVGFADIIEPCLALDPADRPLMSEIATGLAAVRAVRNHW